MLDIFLLYWHLIYGGEDSYLSSKIISVLNETMVAHASKGYKARYKDRNHRHLEAAQCWDRKKPSALPLFDIEKLSLLSELKPVHNNMLFFVSDMTHSRPLLQGEAVDVLEEISRRFQEKLEYKGLPVYRIILTSATRSIHSQALLEKVNDNAAKESAHWYGYTFDISFATFIKKYFWSVSVPGDVLKSVLSDVVWKMREEQKIWVIPEYGPSCFHITLQCTE